MKKAQTTLEYLLFLVLTTIILGLLTSALWNRDAVINGSTFGVEDNRGKVHIRPMTD